MLYIDFRKMHKNKYSGSGSWVAGACPGSSGTRWEVTLNRTSFHPRVTYTHTPTHSDGDSVDGPIHVLGTSLDCGRKQEHQRKPTQGELKTPHRRGFGWESIFFFFFHQHYNKQNNVSQGPVVVASEEAKDSQKTASAGS